MDASDSITLTMFCLIGIAVLGGLIALAIHLVKKSGDEAKQSEVAFNQMLKKLPQDKQTLFVMQYGFVRKNPTTAVLLALFGGWIGAHKFYLGQTGMGILYLLFCWTYIPLIVSVFEAFVIAGQVGKHNQQKATEIFIMLGA